jgi:Flp pilus assembly protein TadG
MSARRRDGSRGQAMVEFALVAPIFFLMLFAIIEGGRFIFYYEMLNNATREGARYAIVHGSNSSCPTGPMPGTDPNPCGADNLGTRVVTAARNAAVGLVSSGTLTSSNPVWWDCASTPPTPGTSSSGNNGRGQCVTVFVGYTYSTIIPVIPPITISAESTLVVNN